MKPQTTATKSIEDILEKLLVAEDGNVSPNHDVHKQDKNVSEATTQILQLIEEARIDELKKCIEVAGEELYHGRAMAESNDDGSLNYGVEEKYFKDRIKALKEKSL